MWGTYSEEHGGVDIAGVRDDVRSLERKIIDGYVGDVPFTMPPSAELVGDRRAVETLRISRRSENQGILLHRHGTVVEIAGDQHWLAHVIGHALAGLAETAYMVTSGSVPTHLHFDPSLGQPYAPESNIEIVFHLESASSSR